MNRQLIFCVESDKKAQTDWFYIKETIDSFFSIGNNIKLKPIFMGGKTNYKTSKVTTQIKKFKRAYPGESTVLLCVDTDDIDFAADRKREYEEIKNFCKKNKYELIWFSRDIEDVYWGGQFENSKKMKEAIRFKTQNRIESVNEKCLTAAEIGRHKSNIIRVLDKYLQRDQIERD